MQGRHLHAEVSLTLKEACSGFNYTLKLLDNRTIHLTESLALAADKFPLASGDSLMLEGYGMPVFGSPWEKVSQLSTLNPQP